MSTEVVLQVQERDLADWHQASLSTFAKRRDHAALEIDVAKFET
jgi:hypothetical protein